MTESKQNQAHTEFHRANVLRHSSRGWLDNERVIITIVLSLLLSFAIYDFFEDREEGAANDVLLADASDIVLPVLLLLYIWRYTPLAVLKNNRSLEQVVSTQRSDLELWKGRAGDLLKGLSESIDQQFDQWALSGAEKQIALLLLKGFSLRDIAHVRGVSERTVRQQATQIYSKASLRGRAELSAFFLEDLMLPEQGK